MMRKGVIGVLIPYIDKYYQCDLWEGILHEAEKSGYEVLFYCGSALGAPETNDWNSNIIYQLPEAEMLDGIISVSGTLSNYAGPEYFESFIERYTDNPVIHISYESQGYNSITVDNYASMKKIIRHVIEGHDYKTFTYLSGPETNLEAQSRLKAFMDIMKEYHVSDKDYRVLNGNFSKESAFQALESQYVEEPMFRTEVIICANDEMAIGVHDAVRDGLYGLNQHTAFTGFDDVSEATAFSPAFTTVRQPLYQIGRSSVDALVSVMDDRSKQINRSYEGELIIRESCGCFGVYQNIDYSKSIYQASSDHVDPKNIYDNVTEHIVKYSALTQDKVLRQLLGILVDELKDCCPKGSFLNAFYKACYESKTPEGSLAGYYDRLLLIKERIYHDCLVIPNELHDIFFNAAKIIGDLERRSEWKQNYDFMAQSYYNAQMTEELTAVKDRDELFDVILPYVKSEDFSLFLVYLFDEPITVKDPFTFTYPEMISMKLGYANGNVMSNGKVATRTIHTSSFGFNAVGHGLVLHPLFFRDIHFGFIVCNTETATKTIYRTIKAQIANTLERLHIYNQLECYNRQLTEMSIRDPLTNAYNRRGIFRYIEEIKERHDRSHKIGIIFGDIDGLKGINDSFGHGEGDVAIMTIAGFIHSALGTEGELGRIGGDEFVCILDDVADIVILEQFRSQVTNRLDQYNRSSKKPYDLGISLGCALWSPDSGVSLEDVIKESDEELYHIKHKR